MDPLSDVAVNSFAEHNTRHNALGHRYGWFGAKCLGGTKQLNIRPPLWRRATAAPPDEPKLPDVCFIGAHRHGARDVLLELKVLSPIRTAHGLPVIAPHAEYAPFVSTTPYAEFDVANRYQTQRHNERR